MANRHLSPAIVGLTALSFMSALAASPVPAEEATGEVERVVFDFEDVGDFEGLTLDMRNPRRGKYSALWEDTIGTDRVFTKAFPSDVSAYDGLRFWLYSGKATGAGLAVVLKSENPAAEGSDYYQHVLAVDWEGWKEIDIAFGDFEAKREPLGWGEIGELRFASSGFGIKVTSPETRLKFDELRLYGQAGKVPSASAPQSAASGELGWSASLAEAVERSGKDGKPILAMALSESCPHSVVIERELLKDAEVVKLLGGFHLLWFDPADSPSHETIFRVGGTPTLVVTDADGREEARLTGEIGKTQLIEGLSESAKR